MSQIPTLSHKRGDRFSKLCTWKVDGVATAFVAAPRCQLRDGSDALVQELTVTLASPQTGATTGKFTLSATAAETALWPVAVLSADVQNTDTEQSTITFRVNVLADVTR